MPLFDVPENKKVRVIIDTDAACEADDPYTSSESRDGQPQVRIYTDVDTRYILEDMIAKLELFCEQS